MDVLTRISRRLAGFLEERRSRRLACRYRIGPSEIAAERIYLFHIRKTGGTSLIHMFLAAAQASQATGADTSVVELYRRHCAKPNHRLIVGDKVFVGWTPRLIAAGHYFFAHSHLAHHQIALPPRTFTITCFRDPVERVLSHYKMLLHYRTSGIDHPCMATEGPWLGTGFADFLRNVPRAHLLNQLYMFSRTFSVAEALTNLQAVSHVLFLDDFDRGVASLVRKTEVPLRPAHIRKAEIHPEISPAAVAELRDRLRDEYSLLTALRAATSQG